jgi:hypothetical protein
MVKLRADVPQQEVRMSTAILSDKTATIQRLNDAFRTTFAGGKMVMTASVAALPEMVKSSALLKVAEFKDFTPDNDPHGEHDFLSFEHCNRTFFWKCDYYNKEMDGGSENPADPDKTTRVGTLMLAEDY